MAIDNSRNDTLNHVVRGTMRYEVLEKRERLNEEFWCCVTRAYQLRRRLQRLRASDDKPAASRTLVSMLRELTSLPSRIISKSRDRSFPVEEVTHCSLPSMNDEITDHIRQLEADLQDLREFSIRLVELEHEMRDHRLNDWRKYPAARSTEEDAADRSGIERIRHARNAKKRHRS